MANGHVKTDRHGKKQIPLLSQFSAVALRMILISLNHKRVLKKFLNS